MLKRWIIENFKSFRDRTEIDLSAINIFAGPNSSGKSTIIQSILLLKQTIEYAPINRPIALNGPLLKLGTFDDVKNANGEADYIGISWEIDVEYPRPTGRAGTHHFPIYYGRRSIRSVSGEFRWNVVPTKLGEVSYASMVSESGGLLQLQPNLDYASVRGVRAQDGESPRVAYLTIQPSLLSAAQKRKESGLSESGLSDEPLAFDVVDIDPATTEELLEGKPDAKIVGAAPRHFFPLQVSIRYDANKERAQRIADVLCGEVPAHRHSDLMGVKIPPRVVQLLENRIIQAGGRSGKQETLFPDLPEEGLDLGSVTTRLQRQRTRFTLFSRPPTPVTFADLRAEIAKIFEAQGNPRVELDFRYPSLITEAAEYVRAYFMSAIRYLGPLRDEPKPIYPLEALANPTDVGYKGEHTAAVLDLHRDTKIEYIPSAFFQQGQSAAKVEVASLHDAVVDWLSYVGVAEEVNTADIGKFGHQLRVQTEGVRQFHDLTNVGVGVSQVLPIIVMALLAEKPAFLIFEQPELHLHPKVQARLADFFLSVALNGKQCLLETHSEYLIERLRLRVAEAVGDAVSQMLKIYFTEISEGETHCHPIEVSRYGAITAWPRDFFDQSQIETERILHAASRKRAAERAKGDVD